MWKPGTLFPTDMIGSGASVLSGLGERSMNFLSGQDSTGQLWLGVSPISELTGLPPAFLCWQQLCGRSPRRPPDSPVPDHASRIKCTGLLGVSCGLGRVSTGSEEALW